MHEYTQCPVCGLSDFNHVFSVKDHTVSNENFEIIECTFCSLRITQHIPEADKIGRYYQSDEYISHTDSKEGVFNKIYHVVRNFALFQKRKIVQKYSNVKRGKLLDYGCGTGAFLHEMKKHGWNVTGIEPDQGALQKAKILTGANIQTPKDIDQLLPESFDVITLWHVLEHVHLLNETLEAIKLALKKGGFLFIAVPNYTSYDSKHYEKFWAAYDVPRHLYHFSPKSMDILISSHVLKIENTLPMWFDAFYVSLLSEKYKGKGFKLFNALMLGFLSNLKAIFKKETCSSLIYVIKK